MPTDIKLKNSVTATNAPTSLQQGEVAINITDKKVWVGNAATTPVLLLGSGADGTFTNLTVSGVASFADGTVSLPSITNIGDTNTGIFFPAADTIAFTEGGVESMRIDSNGYLGIGTNSPASFLGRTVSIASGDYGASFVAVSNSSALNWARIDLKNVNNANTTYLLRDQSGNSGLINEGAQPLYFGTSNTERMRIAAGGAVTIRNSISSNNALELGNTNTTAGASFGVKFAGGTNSSDYCISGDNAAGTVNLFNFRGNGDLQFNSGYGSAATAYGCRAWVNFNGTGTVAIRASGNVSSITDGGIGSYTVNFATALPDGNYSVAGANQRTGNPLIFNQFGFGTTSFNFELMEWNQTLGDSSLVTLSIFR